MDIWHRVGRIVRFSNLGTLLFFTLNILLIVAVFGSSGSIVELICIYFFTVAISLSPLGEMCLAAFAGASDIKRVDIKLRVVPLVQYVLDKAKENTSYCPKKVKVKIIHDPAPNAFALGRQTLCITDGLLLLSDDMILGILAHEIGHLSYGHTVIQLLIGGGNIFISGCLLLIKISYWIFSAIMGLFAICSRSGVRGNRPDIFGNDIYATPGGEYTDYDIPGEALTDTRFANMIREAEKYLGYPYVWGGSSPSTSFDCSGFVSYVINHCGNGWSVGRLTANGLMGVCDIIPKSSAKPGDLIFFQGTYDTSGASHVGIYVGNGMMIHCGNPISYASIESNYWQQHFYCFGRIRN